MDLFFDAYYSRSVLSLLNTIKVIFKKFKSYNVYKLKDDDFLVENVWFFISSFNLYIL